MKRRKQSKAVPCKLCGHEPVAKRNRWFRNWIISCDVVDTHEINAVCIVGKTEAAVYAAWNTLMGAAK